MPTDVLIESPAGPTSTAFPWKWLLAQPGRRQAPHHQSRPALGWNTAGVFVSDGGTLSAGANLVISGSQGQGVFVSNNSHASLAGLSITGSGHGGLVVANLSTVAVGAGANPMTQITGMGRICSAIRNR